MVRRGAAAPAPLVALTLLVRAFRDSPQISSMTKRMTILANGNVGIAVVERGACNT